MPANPQRLSVLPHCSGCGRCVAACRLRGLSLESDMPDGRGGKRAMNNRIRCTVCGNCLVSCPRQALQFVGSTLTAS